MPLNILLFSGKAEKGSHSEHLVQRLCVCCGIIGLPAFGFLRRGPSIRVSVSLARYWRGVFQKFLFEVPPPPSTLSTVAQPTEDLNVGWFITSTLTEWNDVIACQVSRCVTGGAVRMASYSLSHRPVPR